MQLALEEVPAPSTDNTETSSRHGHEAVLRTPEELAGIVAQFASSDGWVDRVRLCTHHRWYVRMHHGLDYDIWAISWMPGQSTGFHDHGDSAGAFTVATGILEEHRPGAQTLYLQPGQTRSFGSDYAHDVRNGSLAPAISIHAYSPPLNEMNEYELDGNHLVPREHATERAEGLHSNLAIPEVAAEQGTRTNGIEEVLSSARARLRRLSPEEAFTAVRENDAVLVDIRPEAQRAAEGSIPGALIIERNVLEWRFDPSSSARLKIATSHDLQVIVFCSEGYTSSLAAAALQDIGLWRATDIVGGFQAWRLKG